MSAPGEAGDKTEGVRAAPRLDFGRLRPTPAGSTQNGSGSHCAPHIRATRSCGVGLAVAGRLARDLDLDSRQRRGPECRGPPTCHNRKRPSRPWRPLPRDDLVLPCDPQAYCSSRPAPRRAVRAPWGPPTYAHAPGIPDAKDHDCFDVSPPATSPSSCSLGHCRRVRPEPLARACVPHTRAFPDPQAQSEQAPSGRVLDLAVQAQSGIIVLGLFRSASARLRWTMRRAHPRPACPAGRHSGERQADTS